MMTAASSAHEVEPSDGKRHYDAFISYRKLDPDQVIAAELHKRLEAYRVPRSLRRQGIRKKLGPVFLDDQELAAGKLSEELRKDLKASEFLIVVCSPRTPESPWIDEEIEAFLETHGDDTARVIPLLVEGEPADVCPAVLLERIVRRRSRREGDASELLDALFVDVRPCGRVSTLRQLKTEKLRILAKILDCKYDDLKRRDHERRMRRIRAVAIVVGTLLTAFLGWQYWIRTDAFQIRRVIADAPVSQVASMGHGDLLEDWIVALVEAGRREEAIDAAARIPPPALGSGILSSASGRLSTAGRQRDAHYLLDQARKLAGASEVPPQWPQRSISGGQALLRNAEELLRQKRVDEIDDLLDELLEVFPMDSMAARERLAQFSRELMTAGRIQEASRIVDALDGSEKIEPLVALARALADSNQGEKAGDRLDEAESLIRQHAENPARSLRDLARLFERYDFDEAARDLLRRVPADPFGLYQEHLNPPMNEDELEQALRAEAEENEELREIMGPQPEEFDEAMIQSRVREFRARNLLREGKLAEAHYEFQYVSDPLARICLLASLVKKLDEQQRFKEAVASLHEIAAIQPKPRGYCLKDEVYDPRQQIARSRELEFHWEDLAPKLARELAEAGDLDLAFEAASTIEEPQRRQTEQLGLFELRVEQDQLEREFEELDLFKDDPSGHSRAVAILARGHSQAGRSDEAERLWRQAESEAVGIKDGNRRSMALAGIAQQYAKASRWRDARLLCDDCLDPHKLTVYITIMTQAATVGEVRSTSDGI